MTAERLKAAADPRIVINSSRRIRRLSSVFQIGQAEASVTEQRVPELAHAAVMSVDENSGGVKAA
jgi:hypothetical protein